jgi:hypothetical protein
MPEPISGHIRVRCRTIRCQKNLMGGFDFDSEKWKKGFLSQKILCTTCNKTYVYSRDELILTPAKIQEEEMVKDETVAAAPGVLRRIPRGARDVLSPWV